MKIIVVAHRGKGPTSNFTGPGEELWQECHSNNQLINKVVSKNNLDRFSNTLPIAVFPENTIAAFRQGLEEGADAIELDLFLLKDNIPMVIHDNELNRNISGARRAAKHVTDVGYLGNIVDYIEEELKEQFDLWNHNRIPSLQEVIDFITLFNKIRSFKGNKPIILNIEFKDKNEACVKQTLKRV